MTRRRVCRTRGGSFDDAVLALHPGGVQRLARPAIEPFYDATLEARTRRGIGRWQRAAQRRLEAHPAHYAVTNLILHARAKLAEAAARYVREFRRTGTASPTRRQDKNEIKID